MKSFNKYESEYTSDDSNALTPMIDRQDEYEYGSIEKVSGRSGTMPKAWKDLRSSDERSSR